MIVKNIFNKVHPHIHLIFRVVVGLMFALHGAQKYGLIGDGSVTAFAGAMGLPVFLAYIVATVELVGGLAIVLGLYTRLFAVLGGGVMIGALAMVHFPQGINPLANGGELALMYLVSFLMLIIHGNGKYALEQAFCKKETF